ncbi:MAG: DUF4062 domain-containing protein [Sedimentisphaerales bacterium]|nr:DUF4062 domain-containing protein [Sedimentisphaerales bacterium]
MSATYKCLKVFLCSASGTTSEEKAVCETIENINRVTRDHLAIEFHLVKWQEFAPRTPDLSKTRKQSEYNDFVKECDIFILLLWKRHGSYEPGQDRTNLEREVDEAVKRVKRGDKMMMLTYFRNFEVSATPNDQEKGVITLRSYLHKEGITYIAYGEINEFADRFLPDLYETLLQFEFNTPQYRALRAFWQFGVPADDSTPLPPTLVIGYPGMNRAYMRLPQQDVKLWLRRLVPNIVYEDHRALQKLDKMLRVIRMTNSHTCTLANLPDNWRRANRCWICIPRNYIALERLNHHSHHACFSVHPSEGDQDAWFTWKGGHSCRKHPVRSPLAVYLRLQRKGDDLSREWNRNLRDVVARDYAIIARFPIEDKEIPMREGHLMEYFIGGIRGLGTWGATWFMDHRAHKLTDCQGWGPYQRLLEVTYKDGHIHDVKDVSEESPSDFKHQLDEKYILREIDKVRAGG